MSYSQKIDIIISGTNRINELEQSLAEAEARADGLRESISSLKGAIKQSFGQSRELRTFSKSVEALQKRLKMPKDENNRFFVGGERRQQFEQNKRALAQQAREIRGERIVIARANRDRLANLRSQKRELKSLASEVDRFDASLRRTISTVAATKKQLDLQLRRDEVVDRFRGRVENFARRGAGKKLGPEAVKEAKEIQDAFESLRKIPARNNKEFTEQTRLLNNYSRRYVQLVRRQNEQVQLVRDRALVGKRVSSSNARIDELVRTGQITEAKSKQLKAEAKAAGLAVNRQLGDAESAYAQLRKLDSKLLAFERKRKKEKRQTDDNVTNQRALNSIDVLQRRIDRLAASGADQTILEGPQQAVAKLSRALDKGKIDEYRVGVERTKGAITRLEQAEKSRLQAIAREQKPLGPATALGGGAELRERNKYARENKNTMEALKVSTALAEMSFEKWGNTVNDTSLDLEAVNASIADTANNFEKLGKINKANLKIWDDQLAAIEANREALAKIQAKILGGKSLSNKELEQWMNGGTSVMKALPPARNFPVDQPLPRQAMLPFGGARLIGSSREFLTNAAGRRTYIPELERLSISRLLPRGGSAGVARQAGTDKLLKNLQRGVNVNPGDVERITGGMYNALPDEKMLNAAARGIRQLTTNQQQFNQTVESGTRFQQKYNQEQERLSKMYGTPGPVGTSRPIGGRAVSDNSLQSILQQATNSRGAASAFRGGLSPEQSINQIASVFGRRDSGGNAVNRLSQAAQSGVQSLLTLKDLEDPAKLSIKNLEFLASALTELRAGLDSTDSNFKRLDNAIRKQIRRIEDAKQRKDPNADFLTRRLGARGAAAASEGLIGGAFPLLFGQGLGASVGGFAGGALGGAAGGMLGFGLSLVGTAVGSAVDALMQAAIDTGNAIRDVVGNFDKLKEANIISSRSQEGVIDKLIEGGRTATAYKLIQEDLNRTIGYSGMQRLVEASRASDEFNRALAELGKQMEVFIAGPLTAFLNAVTNVLDRQNAENRTQRALDSASPADRRAAIETLRQNQGKSRRSAGSLAQDFGASVLNQTTFGLPVFSALLGLNRSKLDLGTVPTGTLNKVAKSLEANQRLPQQSPAENQKFNLKTAQENLAAFNQGTEIFSKIADARSTAREFKQEVIAAAREQQDLDRQNADMRLNYERQIGDIRRGIEERVVQIAQENKQKELQIIAKQGEIREAQLRNELATLQGGFGADELGRRLAGAVSTYLQAQMSAESQLEQRRMQFQVELSNQQIEIERYKLDVTRTVARLNIDTAKQVEQININTARRNQDALSSEFAARKQMASRKLAEITYSLRVMQEESNLRILEIQALQKAGQATAIHSNLEQAYRTSMKSAGNAINLATQEKALVDAATPPMQLGQISGPTLGTVSFKALEETRRRGVALSKQFMQLEENLASIVKDGNIKEFAAQLNDIAFSGFESEFNKLNETLKSIDTNQGGTTAIVDGISRSYKGLIEQVQRLNTISAEQKRGMIEILRQAEAQQIAYEKLIPTVRKYNELFDSQDNQIGQLKGSINELLGPVKELDRVMKYINDSGGIDVNPNLNKKLIENANEIDRLTQKLKVLQGIKNIADGWTTSFVDFNRELLKTGNLSQALEKWADETSNKAIDMLLKFTLEPIQENVFKQLAKFFGFEAEKDPILQPVEQMALDVTVIRDKLIELSGKLNAAPVAAAAAVPGNVQKAFGLSDQEIAAAVNTAIGEYGGQDPLGRTDVFANILARSRSGQYPRNLVDVVMQSGQYAPNFGRTKDQVTNPNLYGADLFNRVKAELLNPALVSQSINDVNGRLYFKGVSQYPNMMQGDFLRADGQNFFHGPGREPGLNPQITKQLLGELYGVAATSTPSTAQTQQAASVQYPQTYASAMPAAGTVAPTAGPPDSFKPYDVFSDQISNVENTLITDLYNISSGLDGFSSSLVDTSKMFTDMSDIGAKAFTNIADNIARDDIKIRTAYENRLTVENENITKLQGIGQKLGVGMQILGGIAMGIAGVQQMKKGGTYNTLMGLAGIFGAISQTSFGFGKLFGLQGFASGGRPPLDRPSWVGERGPELWWPNTAGTIVPMDQLYTPGDAPRGGSADATSAKFAATRAAVESQQASMRSTEPAIIIPELPPIKVESDSSVINNVEYVTKEEHKRGMSETAKMSQALTIKALQSSVQTRKRVGMS